MAGIQAHPKPVIAAHTASISAASSSIERPSVPPAPAVFSRCRGQPSLSASASRTVSPARAIALACTSPVLAEPGCRTTPVAPICVPDAQRMRQRRERLGGDVGVVTRAVE
jgi:hypothetical protein